MLAAMRPAVREVDPVLLAPLAPEEREEFLRMLRALVAVTESGRDGQEACAGADH
jgi:hypothetical protein